MLTGMIHGHSGLAYLLVLSSTVHLGVAIANAAMGPRPGLLKAGVVLGRKVEPALMGIVGLLGIVAWVLMGFPLDLQYILGFVAVVAQGLVVVKGTKPALLAMLAGDTTPAWQWVGSAAANLVIIYGIFGLMQA